MPTLPRKDGVPSSDPPPTPPYRASAGRASAVHGRQRRRLGQPRKPGGGPARRQGRPRRRAAPRRAHLFRAQELRNRSAGGALEIYYHLAEAEGKADLLAQGIAQLEKAVRETQDMLGQKLKPPVALDVWTRQLLASQADQVTADMTINQLNGDLKRLLGLTDCGEGWRIWNPENYDVTDAPIDAQAAVAEALPAGRNCCCCEPCCATWMPARCQPPATCCAPSARCWALPTRCCRAWRN